jgi:hypothetical protein
MGGEFFPEIVLHSQMNNPFSLKIISPLAPWDLLTEDDYICPAFSFQKVAALSWETIPAMWVLYRGDTCLSWPCPAFVAQSRTSRVAA